MEIEKLAEILIYYIHAPLGGIALLAGKVSLIATKGRKTHKKFGSVYMTYWIIKLNKKGLLN